MCLSALYLLLLLHYYPLSFTSNWLVSHHECVHTVSLVELPVTLIAIICLCSVTSNPFLEYDSISCCF
jgi:hypothetical protein